MGVNKMKNILILFFLLASFSSAFSAECPATVRGTFDASIPHKTVDGCDIALTNSEISTLNALAPARRAAEAVSKMNRDAQAALTVSDKTMLRISEAVSLGLTTWTTPDVVAYIQYRRSLRDLVASKVVTPIPSAPPYPAGI